MRFVVRHVRIGKLSERQRNTSETFYDVCPFISSPENGFRNFHYIFCILMSKWPQHIDNIIVYYYWCISFDINVRLVKICYLEWWMGKYNYKNMRIHWKDVGPTKKELIKDSAVWSAFRKKVRLNNSTICFCIFP